MDMTAQMFQMQTLTHNGSFVNYGQPKTAEQCEQNRREREARGSLAQEGRHFRFVRIA
jgi:hypothetical protein